MTIRDRLWSWQTIVDKQDSLKRKSPCVGALSANKLVIMGGFVRMSNKLEDVFELDLGSSSITEAG